jgi:RNA polymerase sigma-70 factor (ECF subfamily)
MAASSSPTSASLLDRLRDPGDPEAWARWQAVYRPVLRSWLGAGRLPEADVDDLVQRVLEVVVRKLPAFEPSGQPGAFRTWLRAIAVNVLREFYRERPQIHPDADGLLRQLEDPHSDLSRSWDAEHNRQVLFGLMEQVRPEFTAPTWRAFYRQVVDEVPARQVAAELGLSINAVLTARSRVLNRLRHEARGLLE